MRKSLFWVMIAMLATSLFGPLDRAFSQVLCTSMNTTLLLEAELVRGLDPAPLVIDPTLPPDPFLIDPTTPLLVLDPTDPTEPPLMHAPEMPVGDDPVDPVDPVDPIPLTQADIAVPVVGSCTAVDGLIRVGMGVDFINDPNPNADTDIYRLTFSQPTTVQLSLQHNPQNLFSVIFQTADLVFIDDCQLPLDSCTLPATLVPPNGIVDIVISALRAGVYTLTLSSM